METTRLPRITVTDYAVTRIHQVRRNRKQPEAGVRIAITGRDGGAFTYDMQLVAPGEEQEGDVVVEGPEGIRFHIAASSADSLDNVTVDADRLTGALTVDNPNPLWADPLAQEIQTFLDTEINPAVATHGGRIDLLDVAGDIAYVHMGGGCQGCGMASVTLTQGVRAAVQDRFPSIADVVDTTDHAQGTNPYYQAAKK